VSRRGFLETAAASAGALMTTGPLAQRANGSVEVPIAKLNFAPGSRSDGGLDEVRWAPRVNPSLIRRLYETDARGIVDDELIDEVGCALHARCQGILRATEAHEGGKVRCHRCGHLIVLPAGVWRQQDVAITCDSCAWSVPGRGYLKTYQDKHLNGGGAVALFEAFIGQFERACLPHETMLAIDQLIHGFHWYSVKSPGRPAATNSTFAKNKRERDGSRLGPPLAATNLIYAKNKRELLTFLDTLTYGEGSTPGLRDNKEEWERMLERSDQPAESGFLRNRRIGA
jgi:hypothetical protein